jgi:3-isopropylmalate/(R)-2-methylmalate dehydratase small subunit
MMEPFRCLEARVLHLPIPNTDTDQIVPARFLTRGRADGYGDAFLNGMRVLPDGTPIEGNPVDAAKGAAIMVAGANFGCGSSRESAVYALQDFGIQVVLAPSFGDIFAGNAAKNGLLAATLSREDAELLNARLAETNPPSLRVDLETCRATLPDGTEFAFGIDPFRRRCLLEGLDELGVTLSLFERIAAFEARTPPVPLPAHL